MFFQSSIMVNAWSVLVLVTVLLLSCTQDLSRRVRDYETTYNTHDVERLMAFYADDIRFEITGVWVKRGKEAVRGLAEWDKATNMHMTISDIKVSGDTASFRLVETNDWWKLAGMGEAYYEPCVMIFRSGLIAELRATMTQESLDAYARVWPSIMSWASDHRSEELAELLPGGEFVYGEETARKWIILLQEWRDAQMQ